MANFGNMDWTDGQVSVPGIYPELYYIEKSKITAFAQLATNPSSAAEEVTLVGDHTLEAQAVWKKINCIDVKTQPTAENQGEIRCRSFLNKLKIVITLTNEDATAFCKLSNNTDLVYLFQERDSGKYRQIGSEKFSIQTKATMDIGSNPSGEKGVTIEIEASDFVPFPFYDGAIVTADGDINPSS